MNSTSNYDDQEFEKAIGQFFGQSVTTHVRPDLANMVWSKLERQMRRSFIIKTAIFASGFFMALFGIIWLHLVSGGIISTETVQLSSLLFSDWNIIAGNWRDYLWSIVESLPFVNLAFLALLLWLVGTFSWLLSNSVYKHFKHAVRHA